MKAIPTHYTTYGQAAHGAESTPHMHTHDDILRLTALASCAG
jgi:hypothetical protein